MDLKSLFDGISKQMIIDFESINRQNLTITGQKGSEREFTIATFLQKYLPKRYAISTGEIIDSKGLTSHQSDIVIYDPLNCPAIGFRQ